MIIDRLRAACERNNPFALSLLHSVVVYFSFFISMCFAPFQFTSERLKGKKTDTLRYCFSDSLLTGASMGKVARDKHVLIEKIILSMSWIISSIRSYNCGLSLLRHVRVIASLSISLNSFVFKYELYDTRLISILNNLEGKHVFLNQRLPMYRLVHLLNLRCDDQI